MFVLVSNATDAHSSERYNARDDTRVPLSLTDDKWLTGVLVLSAPDFFFIYFVVFSFPRSLLLFFSRRMVPPSLVLSLSFFFFCGQLSERVQFSIYSNQFSLLFL